MESTRVEPSKTNPLYSDLFDLFYGVRSIMRIELEAVDLTFTHLMALKALHDKEVCTMSRLTDSLAVTHGASTGVVDRLAKLGYVQRFPSPDDRRVVNVSLTESGAELLDRLKTGVLRQLESIIGTLDLPTRAQVDAGVGAIAAAFRASHPTQREDAFPCNK